VFIRLSSPYRNRGNASKCAPGERRRFRLKSGHPGDSGAGQLPGFDRAADVPVTPQPSAETLRLLRSTVAPMLAEVYPAIRRACVRCGPGS
jgi:hypothetical protein